MTNIRASEVAAVEVGSKSRVWVDAYPELRSARRWYRWGRGAIRAGEAKPEEFFTKIEQRIPAKVALHNQNDLVRAGMMVWVGVERHRDRRPFQPEPMPQRA